MKTIYSFVIAVICILLTGCATILTEKADLKNAPAGIRVYPPKAYFFVDVEANKTKVLMMPDYANAYDIKPLTIVSSQEFALTLTDGVVSSFTGKQDTASLINLMKEAAAIAKDVAAGGASLIDNQDGITGTFGLKNGIYVLSEKGELVKLH